MTNATRIVNTTSGPVEVPDPTPPRHINTSRVMEEDMVYVYEEPEITFVLSGAGWEALIQDEAGVSGTPLVAWVALDNGRMFGVVVGEDGRVDLNDDVEDHDGFRGYRHTTNNR